MNFSRTFAALAAASLTIGLIGCSAGMPANVGTPIVSAPAAKTVGGRAMGGQSPIVGAHIYIFAAGTAGYGSASTNLLNSSNVSSNHGANSGSDANGPYVLTDNNGNFSFVAAGLTPDYSCPSSTSLIYLVSAVGVPTASGNNPALYIMSAIGNCQTVLANAATEFFTINEVTTVASVYALAPYMTLSGTLGYSATHIGAPPTGLAGITNAFAEVPNIVSLSLGGALSSTPGGNGTVPSNLINALANALATCVNSSGTTCNSTNQLFAVTTVNGIIPTDTIAAALSIAQNPGNNVNLIVNLDTGGGAPFSTTLTTANDLTMSVAYTGNGISTPQGVAIDGSGNAWVVNAGSNALVELAAGTGSPTTGSSGYTTAGLNAPTSVAVDTSGNVWISNCGSACSGTGSASTVAKVTVSSNAITGYTTLSNNGLTGSYGIALDSNSHAFVANSLSTGLSAFTGTSAATSSPYTATYQSNTTAAAVDNLNNGANVWTVSPTANSVSEFVPSTGDAAPFTASNSYTGAGVSYPFAIAIDASNRPWVVDQSSNKVTVLTTAGTLYGSSPVGGAGLSTPNSIALDGLGNAWISNANGSISEFNITSSTVTAVTPSTGYLPGGSYANGIAVDGSGSIWVTDCGSYCGGSGSGTVYQVIGAAAPVVRPIATGVANSTLATRP